MLGLQAGPWLLEQIQFSFPLKTFITALCARVLWWTQGVKDNWAESVLPSTSSEFWELNSGHQACITVPLPAGHLADPNFTFFIFSQFPEIFFIKLIVCNWKVNWCYKLEIKHILTAWNDVLVCLFHDSSKHWLVNSTYIIIKKNNDTLPHSQIFVCFVLFLLQEHGQTEEKFKMSLEAWLIKSTPQHTLEKNHCYEPCMFLSLCTMETINLFSENWCKSWYIGRQCLL